MVQETEEAAKMAKETVYQQTSNLVYKVGQPKSKANTPKASTPKAKDTPQENLDRPFSKGSVAGVGRRTTMVKIARIIMMSSFTD